MTGDKEVPAEEGTGTEAGKADGPELGQMEKKVPKSGTKASSPVSKADPGPPISKMIEMAMGFTSTSSQFHPLFEKFNDDHIHKFLDSIARDDENLYKLQSSNRLFHFLYTALSLAVFIFLIVWLLPQNKDLLIDIIRIIVIFGGGMGAGFGLKSQLDKRRSSK